MVVCADLHIIEECTAGLLLFISMRQQVKILLKVKNYDRNHEKRCVKFVYNLLINTKLKVLADMLI